MAESIIESNGLVEHQCNDIRNSLNNQRQTIRDWLANSDGLLFTFATLDRQKQAYNQVLTSLETLAAELAGQIKGHGQRLQKISGELENCSDPTAAGLTGAVTQILDATEHVQKQIAAAEQKIEAQAESVQMQAILTHTDLLTSLPNRKALEAELARAAAQSGRTPLATVLFVDLDRFSAVNREYGHQGGDVILRQAGSILKKLARGKDLVARLGGDKFALLLNQTTLHDALPFAERVRKALGEAQFSHGNHPLRVTASIGIAQLRQDEMQGAVTDRIGQALQAAKDSGGNLCYRHDGETCHPVSAAFQAKTERAGEESLSLAALWSDSSGGNSQVDAEHYAAQREAATGKAELSGRSLFAANLNRRLGEWKRGGASVSVAVLRVDQIEELVGRFGDKGQAFLRQVLGRLMEATTRDMDERCEFEDGLFALLLPGTDEANALAVAERLCAQVRQCKVRMGSELWDLTASIGVAHCTMNARVMDIMLSAEAAMRAAAERGGDAVCTGQQVQEPISEAKV
jgi:diguanylate cyclase (GGDEF)-like protein